MNATEYNRISKSPDRFFKSIPTGLIENVEFRKSLHEFLVNDQEAINNYIAHCFLDPCIFFNSALWCPNPRGKMGERISPFILYPHQIPAVRELKSAIDNAYDVNIDKSRDEGATFIICGVLILYWLIQEEFTVLLGSRIEELVDRASGIVHNRVYGNEQSLFYKLLYLLNSAPIYLHPRYAKSHMFLQNLDNGASMSGQATSQGFGKGSRATAIAVDELAAVEPKIAQAIIENIADVSGCCIFNSTQGDWGSAHPYAKMLLDDRTHKIILDWTDNPNKNIGLYESPEPDKLIVYDIGYYRERWPNVFDNLRANEIIEGAQVKDTYPFVLDGGVSNYNFRRSVWYDLEEKRPGRTRRGLAQNILRLASGSSDTFFQFGLLENLRDKVRAPYYQGDIGYTLDKNGYIYEAWLECGGANSILSWWGILKNGRPLQGHNYVVGCDLSRGTGTTNSVAAVLDVNTDEIVGMMVTPFLSISDFAEKSVALCEWVGGNIAPLLSWEENGAPEFLKRVEELGYYSLYVKEDKAGHTMKGGNKYGWRSTAGPNGTRLDMLNCLDAALHEGLKENPRFTPLKLYDINTIDEMERYVWFEGKADIGPASMQTETSGAKVNHGDRVTGVGVANRSRRQQPPGTEQTARLYAEESWLARKAAKERKDEEQRQNGKRWMY